MSDSNARIDSTQYLRLPKLDAGGYIAMVKTILVSIPKDAPGSVRHAAKVTRAAAVTLQAARKAARPAANDTSTRQLREVDNEADALHAAVHRRLADYELLAAQAPDAAATAAELKRALYPRGTTFLHGSTYTQWEETEDQVKALAEDGRDAKLRALVGGGFVDALLRVHGEYGEVLGTTKPRAEAAAKVDVAGPLAALAASVQDLCLQLVAVANDGSASAAQRAAARAALRPIDTVRGRVARRTATRAQEPEPTDGDARDDASGEVSDEIPEVA